MRSLKDNLYAVVDLGVVIMIGIAFAGLMVMAYVIWTLKSQLITSETWSVTLGAGNQHIAQRMMVNTTANITGGFDDAISLILVAITIFILAVAISALLMLRGGNQ